MMTMICEYCAGVRHQGKPKNCRGGTWCDCGHRLPTKITIEKLKEEVK